MSIHLVGKQILNISKNTLRSAKDIGQPGKTNVFLIWQLATQLITKSSEIKIKHIIKYDRNNEINLIIVINCFLSIDTS